MKSHNFYGGGRLDRAGFRRKDDLWISEALGHEATRFIPVLRFQHPIFESDAGLRPLSVGIGTARAWIEAGATVAFLGVDDAIPYFAVDLPETVAESTLESMIDRPLKLTDLRSLGTLLNGEEAALLAYARGLLIWHGRHRFCGVCGAPAASAEAGHVRRCTNPDCGTSHFPRTDPAVIMLVTHGDSCLLGRQPSWPQGMYSTLAGFVEPGESLESAVAREVFEEAGIVVGNVTYHSSQPWPFPASIMLGFCAVAETTDIRIDQTELEDARWYKRDWLLKTPRGPNFGLPGRQSIARRLIEDWLHHRD